MIAKKHTPKKSSLKKKESLSVLELILKKVARLQYTHLGLFVIFLLLLTLFLGYGVSMIEFESDMNNEMPTHLPIYQLNDKVTDTFGGQDSVLILFELDYDSDVSLDDIRDTRLITSIVEFQSLLEQESLIDQVTSPALLFSQIPLEQLSDDLIIQVIKDTPAVSGFFSGDYSAMLMIVKADVGSGEDKLQSLIDVIESDWDSVPSVPGVKVTVTGSPSVLQSIMDLLRRDSVFTLAVAALIILVLLFILEQSFVRSILIFIPLLLGIVWTLGTMGWLGLRISIATAGLGAMLLGLGVEYGVFMVKRYLEERENGASQQDALETAVPSVGSAMLGSGLTTIVGFLALSLSIMPILQHLGQSLALGIFYCLLAAIVLAPVIFLLEENIAIYFIKTQYARYKKRKEALRK